MKTAFFILLMIGISFTGPVFSQAEKSHSEAERREDVKRHRALAVVHEAAAKCLESGKPEKECLEKLRQDCKGLGIGKYCGMKHQH
jgi:hypothetical protein